MHESFVAAAYVRTVRGFFCALCLLLLPTPAWAQTGMFFDEFGAGPKAAAMGQAFTAIADDFSAAYYNPAGLSQTQGIFEGTVGGTYAVPRVEAHFADCPQIDIDGQPSSQGLILGVASSLDIERVVRVFPWFKRFSFGIAAFVNQPQIISNHIGPVDSSPHFLRQDERFALLSIAVSFAFRIMDWLSVGGGFIPGQDSYAESYSFAAINKHDDPVMGLRLNITQETKSLTVPIAGVLIKPPLPVVRDVDLSLGVVYRGKNFSHQGKGTVYQSFGFENKYGNPTIGIYYPTVMNFNLAGWSPQQVSFGLAARIPVCPAVVISYDMTWKDYSAYLTSIEQAPVPPFRDTFTQRVGIEVVFEPSFSARFLRNIRRIGLRGGYFYEPTPVEGLDPALVESNTPSNNIFDSDQDVFSAGLGVNLVTGKIGHDVQFFYQYHRFHSLDRMAYLDSAYAYFHNIPIYDRYVPVEIGGYAWSIGLSYTLRF